MWVVKTALKYTISTSISVCAYPTWQPFDTFYSVTTIHLCRTSVTKPRGQRRGAAPNMGYHRFRNLESNYNWIPKYPSPNYTRSLSRVPVSRLVSQTRIGRTTKIGRREESETGWPARWWFRSRQGWPRIEVARRERERHVFCIKYLHIFIGC